MSPPTAIPCVYGCGRRFGGDETLRRHRDNRSDRCRSDQELRARGMEQDTAGVWRRLVTTKEPSQEALFDRRTAAYRKRRRQEAQDSRASLPGMPGPKDAERTREPRQNVTNGAVP